VPWVARSDFTAPNGSAWPLTPGSWSHVTESGAITATEQVQANAGRHTTTVAAVAIRRHHAGTATANGVEVRARWARLAGTANVDGGLLLRGDGAGTYIYVRVAIPAKTLLHGVRLATVVNGTHIQRRTTPGVANLNTTSYVWCAARIWDTDGVTVVQAKTWRDGTAEPDWPTVTSFGAGDGSSDTGTNWARLWHVLSAWAPTDGTVGLVTAWLTASTGSLDYDDFSANEIVVLGRATATAQAQPLGARKIAPIGTATVTAQAQPLGARKIAPIGTATVTAQAQYVKVACPCPPTSQEETGLDVIALATEGTIRIR
jgi:hypothetical protein